MIEQAKMCGCEGEPHTCEQESDTLQIMQLVRERDEARDQNKRLREYIAASKECADAQVILELQEENEQIRLAATQAIEKLNEGATLSNGFCSWCNEKWFHLDGATFDDIREQARKHAYRCKSKLVTS